MKMKENKTLQWLPLFLVLVASFFFLLTSSEEAQADTSDSVADGIRIDCGAREDYTDPKTKSSYKADDFRFVEYGEAHNVSSNYTKEQIRNQLKTLTSFPKGKRNCYTVPITPSNNGNTYLVRTSFAYGNYDNKGRIPSFDLYIGVNYWATFNEANGDIVRFEVIHVSSTDEINVCLVNTGHGTPFISLLEVFPWQNSRYDQIASSFLRLMSRSKLGMSENDTTYIRYPYDIYGRSWFNRKMENSVRINTSMAIDSDTSENTYKLPKEVLSSAVQSVNAYSSLVINMDPYSDPIYDYYVYLHFYDFVNKSQNQQRKMVISFSDGVTVSFALEHLKPTTLNQQRKMVISFSDGVTVSFALEHLKPTTLVRNIKKRDDINYISIRSTSDSQLPAMLNAYEIYRVLPQQQLNSTTNEGDVVAIQGIKGAYGIKKISWQGDPCRPMDCTWEGLICNNNGTPRITSINLSFSNLTGEIAGSFSNFPELKVLNLSNNSLTGEIPESLAVPPKLIYIILTGNEIKGPIPPGLKRKMNAGNLNISADDKLEKRKKRGMSKAAKVGTIVGGTVGGSAVVISGLAYTLNVRFGLRFDMWKKRKQRNNESRSGKKKNEEERRSGKKKNEEERRSGKKKEDNESEEKTTVGVRVKATNNTGESGSESLIGKVSDAIQEQISGH